MQLTIARKELHDALSLVGRAVATQSTLPILRNILIEPLTDSLRLSATDLALGIEVLVPAKIQQGGPVTVPAKTFQEIIAALPEADVTLETEDTAANTSKSCPDLRVTCRRSEFRVHGLTAEDFPALPEVGDSVELELLQLDLKRAIRQTLYAVSDDDSRPILTGVFLSIETGCLRMVGTDTHRLAIRTFALPAPVPQEASAIIPARAMTELLRALGEGKEDRVRIRLGANQAQFSTDRVSLISRLIEGTFPQFARVVPTTHSHRLVIQKDDLHAALRRARIVAREGAAVGRVLFTADGETLAIEAESADLGRVREEIEVAREGEPISIAFQAGYLLDVLTSLESEGLALEMSGPLSPAVVRPIGSDDYLVVVMPMQLE